MYYSFLRGQETAWFAATALPLYAGCAGWQCNPQEVVRGHEMMNS
jgi:hypothetical protein